MKDFLNKKNIINLLLLGIMVLAIPLTAKLARQQQILFSRAAEQKVEFLTKDQGGTPTPDGKSCVVTRKINGADKPVSLCKEIKVKFTTPTGADLKFQSRTSLLQEGFVSKALAQEDGCGADGDRSEEAGDSDIPNCGGHKVCHYEGDILRWGGYTCEFCTNEASNPPDCNNQGSGGSGDGSGGGGSGGGSDGGTGGSGGDTSGGGDGSGGGGSGGGSDGGTGSNVGASCSAWSQECTGGTQWCIGGVILDDGNCGYGSGQNFQKCVLYEGSDVEGCNERSGGAPGGGGTSGGGTTGGSTACYLNGGNVDSASADNGCRINHPGSQGKCDPNNAGPYGDGCAGPAGSSSGGGTPGGGATTPGQCWSCNNGKLDRFGGGNSSLCTDNNVPDCPQNKAVQVSANDISYLCKSTANSREGITSCTPNTSGSVTSCIGQLTKSCGASGYPNNQLGATWNLSGTAGSCNVFIRDAKGDHPINTGGVCNGSWSSTNTGSPITGNEITNDGNFKLFVSNGTPNCLNQEKGNQTLSCGQPGPACDTSNNTLTSTCGTQAGAHKLTAKWLVRNVSGGCNIFIRAGKPGGGSTDIAVNQGSACSGERTFSGTFPNGDVITNDGHYQLIVSNGSTCNNEIRGDVTLTCTSGGAQKCFVCENGKYRFAGTDGALSSCPSTATTCNPENANTCKSNQDLKDKQCNTVSSVITKIRFAAGDKTDVEKAEVKDYREGGDNIFNITFADTNPGQKFVWVQFGDNNGNWTEAKPGNIFFAGPDPVITGAACNLELQDNSLQFVVQGDNFGGKDPGNSKLVADTTNLEIKDWTNQKVTARLANPPDTTTGKTFTVNLTRSDGVKTSANCSVNTTQISLGAKLFCRAPRDFDQDNVKLLIVQNALGIGTTGSSVDFKAGAKQRETVTITKEGIINLKTKLQLCGENGQDCPEYKVCIKAPKSVNVCSNKFKAIDGNNIIQKFDLAIGDVNDDGIINSADAGICKSEWGPGKGNKRCEFNRDNVTNVFEWGCLIHDFNKSSTAEPS